MNILPDLPPPSARSLEDLLWREVQMMTASGWTLLQRWPGGATFHSVTSGGFPMWAHMVLLVLTVGVWLPFFFLIEATSRAGKQQWVRLTFDAQGQPVYQQVDRNGNPK